jgi:glucans biosynthesis protein C
MAPNSAVPSDAGASERIHALDGLRTVMLFLVVLYHCLLSYIVAPSRNWGFKDQMTTAAADLVLRFVHAFTLPTFFMLAGFFSAMLYLRRGPEAFARNRAMRIALPFAVGWMILHPFVAAGFVFAKSAQSSSWGTGLAAVGAAIADGSLLFPNSTMHLWFMYDLVIFYLVVLALAPLVMRVPAAWRERAVDLFGAMMARPWLRLPVLALITFGMLRMVGGTLYGSLSFVPNGRLLLGYGMYFGIGWLLYLRRDLIRDFERFAWTHAITGLVLFFFAIPAARLLSGGPLTRPTASLLSTMVGATIVWLLFFGLTGLFLRHFNRPSPIVRYVVDASFWIYLIHLPFAIWLPGLISAVDVPALTKIPIVFGVTVLLGFVTYDLFVRSTLIGSTLNGRRYQRALFGTSVGSGVSLDAPR